jgi:protein arginine kinase activator
MENCPISGKPCDNARTTQITDLKDGKITTINVCKDCVSQCTPEVPAIPPEFLSLMKAILKSPCLAPPTISNHPPCPKCGHTTADIVSTGKFGCPTCYTHFQSGTSSILARCQMGATQHIGKRPKNEIALDKEEQIKNLKLKMARAIEVENYEVAGVLKKKIEELQ